MLQTSRLNLRWAELNDAPLLLELNQDPAVMRFMGDRPIQTIPEALKEISQRLGPQRTNYQMGRFLAFLKDGTFIGQCGLRYFPESNEVDLGYKFLKKYWGQGFATEAARASLEYGLYSLKLKRIIAKSQPDNVASIKVLQKIGMTFRGVVKEPTDNMPWVLYDIKV